MGLESMVQRVLPLDVMVDSSNKDCGMLSPVSFTCSNKKKRRVDLDSTSEMLIDISKNETTTNPHLEEVWKKVSHQLSMSNIIAGIENISSLINNFDPDESPFPLAELKEMKKKLIKKT